MATALARGFVKSGVLPAQQIFASDLDEKARTTFAREVGGTALGSNRDVALKVRTLILAVKPDQVTAVMEDLKPVLTEEHLLVSIAAGMRLERLEATVGAGMRVIRVMPNTPALVGASASAFARGKAARPEDCALVQKLFAAVGVVHEVKEHLFDAVTGLSGSGPAYIYTIIEALSDGGVAAGLPRAIATNLAAQTVLGSARMVLETGLHPGALKDMVTSPGGTTIEGLHELEKAGVRAAMSNAVRAAAEKSRKLSQL